MRGRSRHRTPIHATGYFGPMPEELWEVLTVAWEAGLAVSSNMARELAPEVALAASMGWISTVSLDGRTYQRVWHITAEGMMVLRGRESGDAGAGDDG